MRYHALATDYDGTIATHGAVDHATDQALDRLRASGRKLLLVTGRQIGDLEGVYPALGRFDAIVAENGALIYRPVSRQTRLLAAPPPVSFVRALRARGVDPIAVGHVIVATESPHESTVLEVIRSLGLELEMILNKGAVMVLPLGVNKATGLRASLEELGLSPHNVVAVGDAENDQAFLSSCECGVAVANALTSLKTRADWVTDGGHGAGVSQLVEALLRDDLAQVAARLGRHDIPIGSTDFDRVVDLPAYGASMLVTGTSAERSTIVSGLIHRMADRNYQHCILDPTGEQTICQGAVGVACATRAPTVDEVIDVLQAPDRNAVVNLVALVPDQRPLFTNALMTRLLELRARYGRPHWIVFDEADCLLPARKAAKLALPVPLNGMLLTTSHPGNIGAAILGMVGSVLAAGCDPKAALEQLARTRAERVTLPTVAPGESLLWRPGSNQEPIRVRPIPGR